MAGRSNRIGQAIHMRRHGVPRHDNAHEDQADTQQGGQSFGDGREAAHLKFASSLQLSSNLGINRKQINPGSRHDPLRAVSLPGRGALVNGLGQARVEAEQLC